MGDAEGGRRNCQSKSVFPTLTACLAPAAENSATNKCNVYILCRAAMNTDITKIYIYIWIDRYIFIQPVYVYICI